MKRRYKPRKCPRYKTDEERMEAICASVISWRKRNKDKINLQQARYYLKEREKILAKKKLYYQENREAILSKAKERERLLPAFSTGETNEILRTVEKLLKGRGKK